MKTAFALAAPFALTLTTPAIAEVTIIDEQTGGFVPGSNTDGNTFEFGDLPPGVYDVIFQFSGGPGGQVYYFGYNDETFDQALQRGFSGIRESRTASAYRFTVTEENPVSSVFYGVQNYNYLGYSYTVQLAAVPEPLTWALLILGFGAVGGAMRYRRRVSTNVRYSFN